MAVRAIDAMTHRAVSSDSNKLGSRLVSGDDDSARVREKRAMSKRDVRRKVDHLAEEPRFIMALGDLWAVTRRPSKAHLR